MSFRSISIDGEILNIVEYIGPLWRADKEYFQPRTTANKAFDRPIKYFALIEKDVASYATRNPYIQKWSVQAPLYLINIMDAATRAALHRLLQKMGMSTAAINTAFPLNKNGHVYRYSEENTQVYDDDILMFMCELGLDGYYMERQVPRERVMPFHSEVGLCASAFHKLVLSEITRSREPPRMPNRRTIRRVNNRRVCRQR
jgi:hypothetical protein